MSRRILFTLIALAIFSPMCCILSYGAESLLGESIPLTLIAFFLIGTIFLGATVWFGNYLANLSRSASAAVILAEEMGLAPLNEPNADIWAWFGGSVDGFPFGIGVVHRLVRYNMDGQSRTRFTYQLRTVIPLQGVGPKNAKVVRPYRSRAKLDDFTSAFPVQENAGALTEQSRQAMLDFVRRVEKKGCLSINLFGPKGRNLSLYTRSTTHEGLLAPGVFADADLLLVHDQADAIYVTREQLLAIVREMAAIARTLPRS